MPALSPPVADDRSAPRGFPAYQQGAYFAVCYGLTDEQARATPSVSALSVGGLVKHATGVQQPYPALARACPVVRPDGADRVQLRTLAATGELRDSIPTCAI